MTQLETISSAIRTATATSGRPDGAVRLVAVSKVQPNDRIHAVLKDGHRLFGENRVQEAAGKWPAFREEFPDVELHLIGPLQTNKIRQALDLFDTIQTLDRPKLAQKIADEAKRRGACPKLLVQVNTGAEPQKAGILLDDADDFIRNCRDALRLPVIGVMAIPPIDEEPEPHFRMLADIAARNHLTEISMGMSSDFETAIRCGATMVRVGSALFGERVRPE